MNKINIGIIGCGKMGQAILNGLQNSSFYKNLSINIFDPFIDKNNKLFKDKNILNDENEIIKQSQYIIIAVKPQEFDNLFKETSFDNENNKIIISIVAGITLKKINSKFNDKFITFRVMPNTPALIGQGITAISYDKSNKSLSEENISFVENIFNSVGETIFLDEKYLNAVTGLSGSGPAYVYTFIESLADGGVLMGLPKDIALKLACQTIIGSANMVNETKLHPAILKDQVTSPAGTTISGLSALEKNNFRSACIQAVQSATQKSIDLSKL